MSLPAVLKHLRVLQRAGLITQGRDAQRRPCGLEAVPLREVADRVAHYEAELAAMPESWHDAVYPGRDRSRPRPAYASLVTITFEEFGGTAAGREQVATFGAVEANDQPVAFLDIPWLPRARYRASARAEGPHLRKPRFYCLGHPNRAGLGFEFQ